MRGTPYQMEHKMNEEKKKKEKENIFFETVTYVA